MPDALPPPLRGNLAGALQSPHELRVESRTAIPRLAAFLAERHGVEFAWRTAALGLERGVVHTARGAFRAPRIILAPGADIVSLAPEVFERRAVALVVDDSHHHAPTPDPFQPEPVDRLILEEFRAVLGAPPPVVERWTGVYPSGPEDAFFEDLAPGVRLVSVTSGTGASTAFGLAADALADLLT
mgnify:FL=1